MFAPIKAEWLTEDFVGNAISLLYSDEGESRLLNGILTRVKDGLLWVDSDDASHILDTARVRLAVLR